MADCQQCENCPFRNDPLESKDDLCVLAVFLGGDALTDLYIEEYEDLSNSQLAPIARDRLQKDGVIDGLLDRYEKSNQYYIKQFDKGWLKRTLFSYYRNNQGIVKNARRESAVIKTLTAKDRRQIAICAGNYIMDAFAESEG